MSQRTVEVIIATVEERLPLVASVLLPPTPGVSYLVSCQTDNNLPNTFNRPDVRFVCLTGRGLSRNRNNGLLHAKGDYIAIADDDERLCLDTLLAIPQDFDTTGADVLLYQYEPKRYPTTYVSSVEIVMQRHVAQGLRFDERFGLGAPELSSGEEEVFVCDARRKGYRVERIGRTICRVEGQTTGQRWLTDPRVQRSLGATAAYTKGRIRAYLHALRLAAAMLLRHGRNPLPLLRNTAWGIRYV